ncbi:SDR family oxidoreductase [Falsirhodobacter halotolerans]|uniref:SDR family oxidoreductase n=1 Tax=Falsirhodobacter halotolerans TaxID=1146892 RepID=UPI001FD467D6|nr:SDR family oxidoreductase [Falsirhodobacter halotolerans]MCJ8138247.1 SDR family oxidoreductase [Falsirhodobacter halotolerans]
MSDYPRPPFPDQPQDVPGDSRKMTPVPDCGEKSYVGTGRLKGRVALITGGDSGIGRAVAIAYAREGADVAICYLSENEEAQDTVRLIEAEGRRALAIAADIGTPTTCRDVMQRVVDHFGWIDILVNNAAHQMTFDDILDIRDSEWDLTFRVNIHAMFWLTKAALPHMKPGSSIINTTSINADKPGPSLLAYATTKGAIQNFTAGLAQMLAPRGVRVNCVAPGPIWTPLIPSTMTSDSVQNFGQQSPMGRPGQPAELASAYVMLAEAGSSYTAGATIAVTGGMPMI